MIFLRDSIKNINYIKSKTKTKTELEYNDFIKKSN